MAEYARGGIVKGGTDLPAFLVTGCDYIIPKAFADKWKELLLELNQEVDRTDEDGVR